MARTFQKVTIYDKQIADLFAPGHSAYRFGQRVSNQIKRTAERTAPRGSLPRPGQKVLARSHNAYSRGGRASLQSRWVISNTARHAEWVHEGTTGPITPKASSHLVFRAGGKRGNNLVRVTSVAGQKANPWLQRAANIVNARYLRGNITIG